MRKKHAPISDINVVPYLDVMLVLLVIFMITAPLFNQGVVDLPSVGDTQTGEQPQEALEITYEPSGENQFTLIDHSRDFESPKMNLTELMIELSGEQILRPDVPIIISADGALQYKEVIELLGRLQDEGFADIGLAVKNEK